MSKTFLTDESKQALTDSIKSIESDSSAEIVIAVRARSGSYLHVPVVLGVVAAFVTQAVLLYSDYAFSLLSILLEPFVVGALVGLAANYVHPLKRWLTPASGLQRRVERAARATFFEKGVRHTRARTGVLVYISLIERMAELIMDSGVEDEISMHEWAAVERAIKEAVARGDDGVAVAAQIEKLSGPLRVLERGEDDINELPDEVCA